MRTREVHIQFWLNRKEAETLQSLVEKSGLCRAAFFRQLIRGLVPREAPPPDYYGMMRQLYRIGTDLDRIAAEAHRMHEVDIKRYEEAVREFKEAVQAITEAVVLPEKR